MYYIPIHVEQDANLLRITQPPTQPGQKISSLCCGW